MTLLPWMPAFASGQVSAGKYIGAFDGQPGSKIKLVVGVADGRGTVREIRSKNFALTCEDETVGAKGSATLCGRNSGAQDGLVQGNRRQRHHDL